MKVDDLKLDGQNARKRSDRATGQLAKSLEEFGAARSVVMDADGVIRAGNGTVEAAKAAGINKVKVVKGKPDELVVVQRSDLSGERAAAYAIADNRTSELAEWDTDRLGDQLAGFNDFTAADLGFEATDLAELFPVGEQEVEDIEPQIDRAEELQKEWGTETGQLWEIGEHRLLCGDSTSEVDVQRLMGGETPFLMVTDPPYGVALDPRWRDKAGLNSLGKANDGAQEYIDSTAGDTQMHWPDVWPLFKGTVAYVWCGDKQMFALHDELLKSKLEMRQVIIWVKMLTMTRTNYWSAHEQCLYLVRKGKPSKFDAPEVQRSTIDTPSPKGLMSGSKEDKLPHPAQKPIECMAIPIRNHAGDVYDPFLGSGTTMLAAEQLGRRCYGMEISPKYCAVILQRMKDAGCEPKRGKDGS